MLSRPFKWEALPDNEVFDANQQDVSCYSLWLNITTLICEPASADMRFYIATTAESDSRNTSELFIQTIAPNPPGDNLAAWDDAPGNGAPLSLLFLPTDPAPEPFMLKNNELSFSLTAGFYSIAQVQEASSRNKTFTGVGAVLQLLQNGVIISMQVNNPTLAGNFDEH